MTPIGTAYGGINSAMPHATTSDRLVIVVRNPVPSGSFGEADPLRDLLVAQSFGKEQDYFLLTEAEIRRSLHGSAV